MKKIVENQMISNEGIIDALAQFQTDVDQVPSLSADLMLLYGYKAQYQALFPIAELTTKGLTVMAQKDKKALAQVIFLLCNRVCQFAIKNKNDNLVQQTNYSLSYLEKMSFQNILSTAEQVLIIVNDNEDNWGQMNITNNDVDDLANAKQKLEVSHLKTPHVENEAKAANKKIDQLLTENRKLVFEKIIPTLKAEFLKTKPQIVDAAINVLDANRLHYNKLALRAQVINSETNEPITGCMIMIQEIDFKRRVTSPHGRFQLRHLDPGEYIIICTHEHYQALAYKFIHAWGETSTITLLMTPISIQQQSPAEVE